MHHWIFPISVKLYRNIGILDHRTQITHVRHDLAKLGVKSGSFLGRFLYFFWALKGQIGWNIMDTWSRHHLAWFRPSQSVPNLSRPERWSKKGNFFNFSIFFRFLCWGLPKMGSKVIEILETNYLLSFVKIFRRSFWEIDRTSTAPWYPCGPLCDSWPIVRYVVGKGIVPRLQIGIKH